MNKTWLAVIVAGTLIVCTIIGFDGIATLQGKPQPFDITGWIKLIIGAGGGALVADAIHRYLDNNKPQDGGAVKAT